MAEFDPRSHRLAEPRWFDDFRVGEVFRLPSRTMTDAHFLAFQAAIQTVAGAGLFPHQVEDSLLGFIEQSSRFLKGVYAGDTLYSALEITELQPQRTTGVIVMRATVHNQRGELVLDGMHKYLIRKRLNKE